MVKPITQGTMNKALPARPKPPLPPRPQIQKPALPPRPMNVNKALPTPPRPAARVKPMITQKSPASMSVVKPAITEASPASRGMQGKLSVNTGSVPGTPVATPTMGAMSPASQLKAVQKAGEDLAFLYTKKNPVKKKQKVQKPSYFKQAKEKVAKSVDNFMLKNKLRKVKPSDISMGPRLW